MLLTAVQMVAPALENGYRLVIQTEAPSFFNILNGVGPNFVGLFQTAFFHPSIHSSIQLPID
jgi:hypothetical protein